MSALAMAAWIGGKDHIKTMLRDAVRHYMILMLLVALLCVLGLGALLALSFAVYHALVPELTPGVAWLLIALVYGLGAAAMLIVILIKTRHRH
ncbi:MAG: hypothetical protein ACOCZK_02540 [Planctomycetota bacterium]